MALRTTCLCDGKIIGIESIYTVVNGLQINIPDRVEALREKGRNNQLFCPCGCGANLILVAGDRNLREQHFRLKKGQSEKDCEYVSEGLVSIYSKIVLQCWLADKCPGIGIKSRVPICAVDDTDRRYELTLLAEDSHIAISYCRDRSNLSDDKLEILDANSAGIQMHYIADIHNAGTFLQYPEMLIKVQQRQGYCLFLNLTYDGPHQVSYANSELKATFCYSDNGIWKEIDIVSDLLSTFSFNDNGDLLHFGTPLLKLKDAAWKNEQAQLLIEQERQKKESEREQQEYLAKLEQQRAIEAEAERKRKEQIEIECKAREEREKVIKEYSKDNIDAIIDDNQDKPFIDPEGNRWVRCEYCGNLFTAVNFVEYGGIGHANLGKCRECSRKTGISVLPKYAKKIVPEIIHTAPKPDPMDFLKSDTMTCPECGGSLIPRFGPYGKFLGCKNYPKCKYTRNV